MDFISSAVYSLAKHKMNPDELFDLRCRLALIFTEFSLTADVQFGLVASISKFRPHKFCFCRQMLTKAPCFCKRILFNIFHTGLTIKLSLKITTKMYLHYRNPTLTNSKSKMISPFWRTLSFSWNGAGWQKLVYWKFKQQKLCYCLMFDEK